MNMGKKLEKILKRKDTLVELANDGYVWCNKHEKHLTGYEVLNRKCYLRKHSRHYCPYVKIEELKYGGV